MKMITAIAWAVAIVIAPIAAVTGWILGQATYDFIKKRFKDG